MLPTRKAKQKCLEATSRKKRYMAGPSSRRLETSFEMDKQTDCAICLETVNVRGKLGVCNHWFCFQCIYEWSKMTNICPLCKLRFRCITKINLKPWASPAKTFRIQDKDQKLEQTAEDLEVAMALENEASFDDDNDPDYDEESRDTCNSTVDDLDNFDYEDSFIDDTDAIEDRRDLCLKAYLQRVERLRRSPYRLRRSSDGTVQANEPANLPPNHTRQRGTLDSPIILTQEKDSEENRSQASTGRRRRKRRSKLTYPVQRRKTRNSTRSSSTVSGWINMASKRSGNYRSNRAAVDTSEDSDNSEDPIKMRRRRSRNRKLSSSDEEVFNELGSNVNLTDDDFSSAGHSPSVVSSQNSAEEDRKKYNLRTCQTAVDCLTNEEYLNGLNDVRRNKYAKEKRHSVTAAPGTITDQKLVINDGIVGRCRSRGYAVQEKEDDNRQRNSARKDTAYKSLGSMNSLFHSDLYGDTFPQDCDRMGHTSFQGYRMASSRVASQAPSHVASHKSSYTISRPRNGMEIAQEEADEDVEMVTKSEDYTGQVQRMGETLNVSSNNRHYTHRFASGIRTFSSNVSEDVDRRTKTMSKNKHKNQNNCQRKYQFRKITSSMQLNGQSSSIENHQHNTQKGSLGTDSRHSYPKSDECEKLKALLKGTASESESGISSAGHKRFSGEEYGRKSNSDKLITGKQGFAGGQSCSSEDVNNEEGDMIEDSGAEFKKHKHLCKDENGWRLQVKIARYDNKIDSHHARQRERLSHSVKALNESKSRESNSSISYPRDMTSKCNTSNVEPSLFMSNRDKENFEADLQNVNILASTPQRKPKFNSIFRRKK